MRDLMHQDYTDRLVEFIHENITALGTMVTGLAVSHTDVHKTFSDVMTDPVVLEVVKNYVGIVCTLGGFGLMLYNTFFKKKQ